MPAPVPLDPVACAKFLSLLARAEQMVREERWGGDFLAVVSALSDLAIGPMGSALDGNVFLRSRWDAVFAQSDVEYGR